MNEEAVSLVTLKQTIQKLKYLLVIGVRENIEIACSDGRFDKPDFVEKFVQGQEAFIEDKFKEVVVCVEKLQKQQERKMNVIIRIKSLKAREHFARRLGFENLGHLIGGHPLSTEWKESDWLPENLPPFLGKRKVKEVLGEKK